MTFVKLYVDATSSEHMLTHKTTSSNHEIERNSTDFHAFDSHGLLNSFKRSGRRQEVVHGHLFIFILFI